MNNRPKPYCPSNGSEGMYFIEEHCMNCVHCDPDPNGKKQCDILCRSMCYSPGEPNYPEEWIYDENNEPTCTKWAKWDWAKEGDPDESPNAPVPYNPNQLKLFD